MSFLRSFASRRPRVNLTSLLDRRSFLSRFAATGAASALLLQEENLHAVDELPPGVVPSNPRELLYPTPEPNSKIFSPESGSFAASFPLLQNVNETSATVVWSLNVPSTGWVEWGPTPALGKVARNSEFGLNPYDEDFLCARIFGLSPNTKYYYRTATCAFNYKSAYNKTCENAQYSEIYSFTTPGANAERASFAVMNDTHNQVETLSKLFDRFDELNPDFVVWNGDVCHRYPSSTIAKTAIANPCDRPYAAERHLILARGNHDYKGPFAHNLKKVFSPWIQPDYQFKALGYNAALRYGPLGIIILDTAEMHADSHEGFQGILSAEPIRELQAAWLESALKRPEIASAPYLVGFCHIPLFDHRSNGKDNRIPELNWPTIHPLAAKFWGPILDKSGIQLMISAHLHKFAYSEPTAERPWAQLLGGGPLLKAATCIHAEADQNQLTVTCDNLADGTQHGQWTFKPRF